MTHINRVEVNRQLAKIYVFIMPPSIKNGPPLQVSKGRNNNLGVCHRLELSDSTVRNGLSQDVAKVSG